jgi:hypothetical protein
MCDWIAENAEANRRIDIVRDLLPLFEIGQRVTLGSLQVLHVIPNEVMDLTQAGGPFLVVVCS